MNAYEPSNAEQASWLPLLKEQISTLQYGVIQIVVHDSRVVQIEKTEKVRLDQPSRKPTLQRGSL